MSQIYLYDTEESYENLLPLTFTRPVAGIRIGVLTLHRKWELLLGRECHFLPVDYLRSKFFADGICADDGMISLYIDGSIFPGLQIAAAADALRPGEALCSDGKILAMRATYADFLERRFNAAVEIDEKPDRLKYAYDVFRLAGAAIELDYSLLTAGRTSQPLSESNIVIGDYLDSSGRPTIFIEEGARVEGACINVTAGPVYIGRDAEVMECSSLRGPVAIGPHSIVKMGARIYGGTSLGPWCKVGGELSNVVMMGYSNKAHEGYLGNAVIGEWCNLGAGTNASNLKNDYSRIRVWNYRTHSFMRTDLQFCGLIMGDHSKAGINCMFNTATVVGVGVNIHGSGFPRVFVPSFSEGSPAGGFQDVSLKKFYDIAERVMARRGMQLEEADREIYERVREIASRYK